MTDKTRELRLRNKAIRCGYRLSKSARRDPDAIDFDRYALVKVETGLPVNPPLLGQFVHSWTLDQVEERLREPDQPERPERKAKRPERRPATARA